VTFPDQYPWFSATRQANATVDLNVFFVDLDTLEIAWSDTVHGTFESKVHYPDSFHQPNTFTADVVTGDVQPQIHPFRMLVVHAYYDAGKALIQLLERRAKDDIQ
jgi:hypothetical protein